MLVNSRTADMNPNTTMPSNILLQYRIKSDAIAVPELGLTDAWEDSGPAIEISRRLSSHQLDPVTTLRFADGKGHKRPRGDVLTRHTQVRDSYGSS